MRQMMRNSEVYFSSEKKVVMIVMSLTTLDPKPATDDDEYDYVVNVAKDVKNANEQLIPSDLSDEPHDSLSSQQGAGTKDARENIVLHAQPKTGQQRNIVHNLNRAKKMHARNRLQKLG